MNIEALVDRLEQDEDVRLKPYTDTAGKITIGCGRNLTDCGISLPESRILLANDIAACLTDLEQIDWFRHLSDVRQRVIVNMRFNLGLLGLYNFKKMIGHLERGRYTSAAREMLESTWAQQVGARADRLAVMMITDSEPD